MVPTAYKTLTFPSAKNHHSNNHSGTIDMAIKKYYNWVNNIAYSLLTYFFWINLMTTALISL